MNTDYKDTVAHAFGTNRATYDHDAALQKRAAKKLADHLPSLKAPRVLEIGCGTGFLTGHLFKKYPDGQFDITDISYDMVAYCHDKNPHPQAQYFTLDADNAHVITKAYDIIVSAMAVQWLDAPLRTLKQLSRIAPIYFSTVGTDNFKEWRACLKTLGLPDGTLPAYNWPNIFDEDITTQHFERPINFLKTLKDTGVATARHTYTPISAGHIRRALRMFETQHNATITWHIVYGALNKQ